MTTPGIEASVVSVHRDKAHGFCKIAQPGIRLLAGLGVDGDAHCGRTVQHRSRVARDPSPPNLRQVHLLHAELLEALSARGFEVAPGQLGENITTRGIELLRLPVGTHLCLGPAAIVELTGLRNPCAQIDRFQPGLLSAVISRTAEGHLVRLAGVMAVVLAGGSVAPGDPIEIRMPAGQPKALIPV